MEDSLVNNIEDELNAKDDENFTSSSDNLIDDENNEGLRSIQDELDLADEELSKKDRELRFSVF